MELAHPPRALLTGYRNHEVVGPPHDVQAQRATLSNALRLLVTATEPDQMVDQRQL